ncbi:uncharacterized protein Triagg1_2608 [Trichoderma aggressivum f. europaeum]|uniref:C2H2-type domain-containing protein n=1 Tax=Trichoderma aggressivum f. europaeum TaxID=173218 RepID=A0AAE1M144_9HYPO|nr:hypothetical protein Triagg1_2608 [Trichoderma aggressivum f. europaeum]
MAQMEPQIAPLVNHSLTLFKTLDNLAVSSQDELTKVRSHLARFKLWAGSLGAHRPFGDRSLEYRLRDTSFVRNHVISLLQELVSSIDEGIQAYTTDGDDKMATDDLDDTDKDLTSYFASDKESDAMVTLENIGQIIDCLLRLSGTIRNPAPHDQFLSKAGADIFSTFKECDMKYIRQTFSKLDGNIADRLGIALSRRRQYLKYREELSVGATMATSSNSEMSKNMENAESFTELDKICDKMSEISETSYASSDAATDELQVPDIPEEHIKVPFQCPYCRATIMIEDRKSWKKHVFGDLQPYVCLFDNCSSPNQLYQRRRDWAAHMEREHWVSWSCPFGCPKSFDAQEIFKAHLNREHKQSFESIDLQAVVNMCSSPDDSKMVGICPLCWVHQIQSGESYQSHVGDHLEHVALFVLPQTVFDGNDDGHDGHDHDRHDNDDNEGHDGNDNEVYDGYNGNDSDGHDSNNHDGHDDYHNQGHDSHDSSDDDDHDGNDNDTHDDYHNQGHDSHDNNSHNSSGNNDHDGDNNGDNDGNDSKGHDSNNNSAYGGNDNNDHVGNNNDGHDSNDNKSYDGKNDSDHDDYDENGHDSNDDKGHDTNNTKGHDGNTIKATSHNKGHDSNDNKGRDDSDNKVYDSNENNSPDGRDNKGHNNNGHDGNNPKGHDGNDNKSHDSNDKKGHDDYDSHTRPKKNYGKSDHHRESRRDEDEELDKDNTSFTDNRTSSQYRQYRQYIPDVSGLTYETIERTVHHTQTRTVTTTTSETFVRERLGPSSPRLRGGFTASPLVEEISDGEPERYQRYGVRTERHTEGDGENK